MLLTNIGRSIKETFFYVGTTTILFVILNIVADYYNKPAFLPSDSVFHRLYDSEHPESVKILRRIFGSTSDENALSRYRLVPNFEMHPGLHYMTERVNNPHYHMGLEGIRYDAGWDDSVVKKWSSSPDAVFLFGGSTMLGHGVSGDETIGWYLNRSNDGNTQALNFGAQAYDFQRCSEKLAYLLRIGYRPKKILFLIGWNEIILSARSNLRWQDKLIFHGFAANRGEVAYTPGTSKVNNLKLLADSLPIVQYLKRVQSETNPSNIAAARDPFTDGFDFQEAYRQFHDWEGFAQDNDKLLWKQINASLKAHTDYVKNLSRAFGFEATVVFQPMGLFDPNNPFVLRYARDSVGYKYFETMRANIRREIAAGNLPFVDGSDWLNEMDGDRYVDVAHYSPNANKLIASKLGQLIHTGRHKL